MKALVTGGAGFIGSNLVELLLANGWDVRVIDNLSSGYLENIESLDIDFVNADVCDSESVAKACEGRDVIFHLAASVGRQRSLDNPQLDSAINLGGTINVLEGMRKQQVPKIIYSSSAAIFGELLTPAIDETHPQNADSPYGVSKLAAEKMMLTYSDIYGITGIALRYFNIYGVNQRFDLYGNAIPIFAKGIFSGEPITIYGDGEQTRDFVNVKDIARANLMAAVSNIPTDVFNMGSGESITINQLVNMMIEISGKRVPIEYAPVRPADVLHCKAATEKAARRLGFRIEVKLAEGLERYLAWFGAKGH